MLCKISFEKTHAIDIKIDNPEKSKKKKKKRKEIPPTPFDDKHNMLISTTLKHDSFKYKIS